MTYEELKKNWHYTKDNDYPVVFGKYENHAYPQIPCLVELRTPCGWYGVRFWNATQECWDDEYCDDYYCDKEGVVRWMYIDDLTEND